MKKQLSWFVMAAVMLGVYPAVAATNYGTRAGSSVDLTGGPATRTRSNVNYEKYETRTTTRTYGAQDAKNIYYTQPAKRSDLYKQYTDSQTNVRTTRGEVLRGELQRKYFLAHPFFQPVGGKFGSITDLSYNWGSYDMTSSAGPNFDLEINGAVQTFTGFQLPNGSFKGKSLTIKEDFSYGITDTVAVMGMLRYDKSDYEFNWDNAPSDKFDDSDLTMYGLGAQWRFLDNSEWIATASAYYQHQKDTSNNFILDLKAGYKVASTTVYGLARGYYLSLEEDTYGVGSTGTNEYGDTAALFLTYNDDAKNTFYVEGGVGVFSVLDQDWTLNAEAIFGHYDWHNQLSVKAALGWQPNDWFALNLYAKTSLYDSANGKKLPYMYYGGTVDFEGEIYYIPAWVDAGRAEIDNYRETSIGAQAIFMF